MTTLNIEALSNVLNVNLPNDQQRKENEALFAKFKTEKNFSPLLLEICCNINKKFPPEVELNAAIQLKNFILANWKFSDDHSLNKNLVFDDEQIIVISEDDKAYLRNNILDAAIFAVNIENLKILKQLNQSIKKILKFDFQKLWKDAYINKICQCFESGDQKKIYAGIILLHQVSKIFEFEDDKNQSLYNEQLLKLNPFLLNILSECRDLNVPIQAQFGYKILKIFFKSFQGALPQVFTKEEIFDKWSSFILSVLQTAISEEYVHSRNNIFWSIKRISYQIITRISQKLSLEKETPTSFETLVKSKYLPQYFGVIKTIYSNIQPNSPYVNDYCLTCIYNFFSYLIEGNILHKEIISLFGTGDKLKEQLIKDAMLTQEDLNLWNNDIKSYISKQSENLSMCFTKRYAVNKLINIIMNFKEDGINQKNAEVYLKYFISILEMSLNEIKNENNNIVSNNISVLTKENIHKNLIKESVLYILQEKEKLKMAPNPTEFIQKIIQIHVIPELYSPVGILREKACTFLEHYKSVEFTDSQMVLQLTQKICNLLEKDACLPVKIRSAVVASSLLAQPLAKNLMKGNIKTLLSIFLKLIEESEQEEILDSLQGVIKETKEEAGEYIVQLSNYLMNYFIVLTKRESDDEKAGENCILINNIISTFEDIIHYYINNKEIQPQLSKIIDKILDYCLISESYDKMEEGLDLLEEIFKTGNVFEKSLWQYFVPIINSVIGSDEDIAEFKKQFKDGQIYEGFGFDSFDSISTIICYYIQKDPQTFITEADQKGTLYVNSLITLIQRVVEISESKRDYEEIKYAFYILAVVFDTFKGKVDNLHKQILKFVSSKVVVESSKYRDQIKYLLAICFIYNPLETVKTLESSNEIEKILKFWFNDLENLKSKMIMKYNLIGLCSLISVNPSLQNKLIIDNLKNIIGCMIKLIEKIYELNNNKGNFDEDDLEYKDFENIDYNKFFDADLEDDPILQDESEEYFTTVDKSNEILVFSSVLKEISLKHGEYYKVIENSIGDKINTLKDIIQKEEEKELNKKD